MSETNEVLRNQALQAIVSQLQAIKAELAGIRSAIQSHK
jgi:hypothetical protein